MKTSMLLTAPVSFLAVFSCHLYRQKISEASGGRVTRVYHAVCSLFTGVNYLRAVDCLL